MSARQLRLLWILAGVAAVLAWASLAWILSPTNATLRVGTWLPKARTLSAFQFTDLAGHEFDNSSLLGHPSLLYFGFTFCPDECPTTLATLAQVQRPFPPLPGLQILFVTVDPVRDTAPVVRQYLDAFNPDFIGLRPSASALAPLLSSLGGIAVQVALPGGGYTFEHSTTLYLLDTRGRLVAEFTPPFASAGLRADLGRIARTAQL